MVMRLSAQLPAEIAVALLDTDARSLPAGTAATLQLGRAQTRGMGTGGEAALGLASADSEEAALRRLFAGIPVVVLVTGLGGGTGSGAAPVIAGLAAECGATVLSFATMPFSHEGERRMRQANDATVKLGQKCHGLVVVHNDLLLQQVSPDAPLSESFAAADNWVGGALRGLASAFAPGALIAVDPAALRSLLSTPGSPTLFAFGVGQGDGAAMKAARAACDCPLAHAPGAVAKVASLFVTVAGGPAMTYGGLRGRRRDSRAFRRRNLHGPLCTHRAFARRPNRSLGARRFVACAEGAGEAQEGRQGGGSRSADLRVRDGGIDASRSVRRNADDLHRRAGCGRAGLYPEGRASAAGTLIFASRLRPAQVRLSSAYVRVRRRHSP
jgi:cell division GTPase FtsZ